MAERHELEKLDEDSRPCLKEALYSLIMPDGSLAIFFGRDDRNLFKELSDLQREIFVLMDGSLTVAEIAASVTGRGIECSVETVLGEANRLYDLCLVEDRRGAEPGASRHDRQMIFFGGGSKRGAEYARDAQQALSRARVTVIGLGGFGSHVFTGLARMGVGRITAVDFDRVEPSNLGRQILYGEADIGELKTEVAARRGREMNTEAEYRLIDSRIGSAEDISKIIDGEDLVFLTADTPRLGIFRWANRASYDTGVPVIYTLGVTRNNLLIGPIVVPGKTPCFECSMPSPLRDDDPVAQFINRRHRPGIVVPYVMTASGIMLNEGLKHLTGYGESSLYGRRLVFDVTNLESRVEDIVSRKDCPLCGSTPV